MQGVKISKCKNVKLDQGGHEVMRSKCQKDQVLKRKKNMSNGEDIRGQEVKMSKGQNVKRSKCLKVKMLRGQNVKRSKCQEVKMSRG